MRQRKREKRFHGGERKMNENEKDERLRIGTRKREGERERKERVQGMERGKREIKQGTPPRNRERKKER